MNKESIINELKNRRYEVSWFSTGKEAADYLNDKIKGKTVGFGDSQTLMQIKLHEILEKNNVVYDPLPVKDYDEFLAMAKKSLTTDIFFTSVNAMTEDGIIVNMDGTGNRVAGSLFGHEKTYYVLGTNKICKDLDSAISRVRNYAAPKNGHRLEYLYKIPCAKTGEKCYNCKSPDRICNALLIEYRKTSDMDMEVIIIDEELGY